MSFHISHRMGGDTSDPRIDSFPALLDELGEDLDDVEHIQVSLTHESEWCLSFFRDGYVCFEHLEADRPFGHRVNVSREDCLRLMDRLAKGDIGAVQAEAWLEGYWPTMTAVGLHIIAAGLIVFATFFHSLMGEKKLITPTLAADDPFIQEPMTQAITRFGWHASSGFFLLTALIIVLPDTPELLIWATGGLWLVLGLANLVMAKAKHPGGYLLSLIGALILAGEATV